MKKILLILFLLINFNFAFAIWNCLKSYADSADNYFKNNNVPVFELWNKSEDPIYYSIENGELSTTINRHNFNILIPNARVIGYSKSATQPQKLKYISTPIYTLAQKIDISKPTFIKIYPRVYDFRLGNVYELIPLLSTFDTTNDLNKTIYLSWERFGRELYPQTGPCNGSRGITESFLYTGFKDNKSKPKTNVTNLRNISTYVKKILEDERKKIESAEIAKKEKEKAQKLAKLLKDYQKLTAYNKIIDMFKNLDYMSQPAIARDLTDFFVLITENFKKDFLNTNKEEDRKLKLKEFNSLLNEFEKLLNNMHLLLKPMGFDNIYKNPIILAINKVKKQLNLK